MQGMKNNWDAIDLAMFAMLIVLFLYGVSQLAKATPATTDPRPTRDAWTPTAEDQKYIDSLYDIVKETESNVDTISTTLDRCLTKLDSIANE